MSSLRTVLGQYSLLFGGLAVVAMVAAVLLYIFLPELQENTARVLVGVALLLLVLFILGAYSGVAGSLRARQTRYGANTGLMAVAFIAIVGILNYLSYDNSKRFDLTAGGQYTLSQHTIGVLKNLKEPVKAVGFFTQDPTTGVIKTRAESLLSEYRHHSDKIDYEFIDPEEKPGTARQYEVRDNGAIVFEAGGRRKQLFAYGEQDFTGAILNVTGTQQLKVYFLTGHGEKDIGQSDGEGYSYVRDSLTAENYAVQQLSLTSDFKVPGDAAVVIVASPRKTLLDGEIRALDEYLVNGGKAFVLLDPNPLPEVRGLLQKWGVQVRDGTVADEAAFVNPDKTVPVVQGNQYAFGQITKSLAATFFPGAAGLQISVPQEDTDHVLAAPMMGSSSQSFLETTPERINFDQGQDIRGPLALGVSIEANKPIGQRPAPAAPGAAAPPMTRLVVLADSDFANNTYFYSVSNSDLFVNTVNWLAAQEDLISIRPKPLEFRRLVITFGQLNFISISTIFLWPMALFLAAGFAWWRRR